MSAFSFNTTYQPTGDQQKDAIAQIGIMQNRAVQANLAYQSCRDSGALFKVLHQVNNELHDLRHCCKVSDEAAFCLIQRPYISKTLLT
ncbi:hypothetical protein NXH40_30495, partial [Klebsiella pneumoniae]|nr:hypothetical protein [Klebsiella pneumoniae]MDS7188665.1 hypothetical protein [Klebsiella pneumoniae]MDS7621304.1 hypothetical protein [Klebsiella pneumoniae]MDS7632442.1 hypothetical protein [Klebsiella pneumoniae]MDS7745630.1 hypothetical protein [Klebsiella pneumoniae]